MRADKIKTGADKVTIGADKAKKNTGMQADRVKKIVGDVGKQSKENSVLLWGMWVNKVKKTLCCCGGCAE